MIRAFTVDNYIFVNYGQSIWWFIMLYLLSASIKNYKYEIVNIHIKKNILYKVFGLLYISLSIIIGILYCFLLENGHNNASSMIMSYCSPFVLLSSVALFLSALEYGGGCKLAKCKSYITKLASLTFAVYLIHDYDWGRQYVWYGIINAENSAFLPLYSVLYIISLYSACLIVENVRKRCGYFITQTFNGWKLFFK